MLLSSSSPLPDVAVFHCQQAAEKSLKAFLFWNDVPFRKTHDIEELGHICLSLDGSLTSILERAIDLTPFAWRFRYPGDIFLPSLTDAQDALLRAREVYDAIVDRLPNDVRPKSEQ
ncbi:MAG: HEPN domain-containing protein [Candidatus Abyssobacteria bacterium SURF_17]|uniref:HEPN domain-containing protein n=1 Tax=Candidatus Abyssobacteria bacterium SURF_17 TaxID=2093361 RepID=A0A419F1N9_9BACT|nr:MAG: HEPN domain-containing protein [Candidatus Abyssubacteria bacterium SURF_17]